MNWLAYGAIMAFALVCMVPLIYSASRSVHQPLSPRLMLAIVAGYAGLEEVAGSDSNAL